ncbi:hypothetical protein [Litchfieldia alkalitelluris]|uniref:hypothetical protein n=1 Tax=Litchfieldia alkalitelluris TaxID=304268 RepID=UPI001958DA1E|nr:hypothetical protein [Litchfieldia alkalitelluris]
MGIRKRRKFKTTKKSMFALGYLLGVAFAYLDPTRKPPRVEQVYQLNKEETEKYRKKVDLELKD